MNSRATGRRRNEFKRSLDPATRGRGYIAVTDSLRRFGGPRPFLFVALGTSRAVPAVTWRCRMFEVLAGLHGVHHSNGLAAFARAVLNFAATSGVAVSPSANSTHTRNRSVRFPAAASTSPIPPRTSPTRGRGASPPAQRNSTFTLAASGGKKAWRPSTPLFFRYAAPVPAR